MKKAKWVTDAEKNYPVAWEVFCIHYKESRAYDETYWLVFLTGFIAGGNG